MNHLRNAVRKCHRFMGGPEYVGCLIPMEILALVDAGATSFYSDKDGKHRWDAKIEWNRQQKADGYGGKHWFYFLPPKGINMEDREYKHSGTDI